MPFTASYYIFSNLRLYSFFIQSVLKCHQQPQGHICAHNRIVPEFSAHVHLTYRPCSLEDMCLWSGIPQTSQSETSQGSQILK